MDTKSIDSKKKMGVTIISKPRGIVCAPSIHSISLFFVIILLVVPGIPTVVIIQKKTIHLAERNIYVRLHSSYLVRLIQIGQYITTLTVRSHVQHSEIVEFNPSWIEIPGSMLTTGNLKFTYILYAYGKMPGHSLVTFDAMPAGFAKMDGVFLRVTVMRSGAVKILSDITGWLYFVAWSVSFYPQIYTNYVRKSVVGLNFDFLAYNLMGYSMYSLFNCGLYFNIPIQTEYYKRYPRGHNPVHLNDVFFALGAMFATFITITQSWRYESGNQRVSNTARYILTVMASIVSVFTALCFAGKMAWLDLLYYCSYIKVATSLIKYVPQAYMNFQRKSTVGWSIGYILLDFAGGSLSILQMVLNGWNYDDWNSLFGDVAKLSLGLFSVFFDCFFMLQHYVFYGNARQEEPSSGGAAHGPAGAAPDTASTSSSPTTTAAPLKTLMTLVS